MAKSLQRKGNRSAGALGLGGRQQSGSEQFAVLIGDDIMVTTRSSEVPMLNCYDAYGGR